MPECGNCPVFKGFQAAFPERLLLAAHHRGARLRSVHRNLRSGAGKTRDRFTTAAPPSRATARIAAEAAPTAPANTNKNNEGTILFTEIP